MCGHLVAVWEQGLGRARLGTWRGVSNKRLYRETSTNETLRKNGGEERGRGKRWGREGREVVRREGGREGEREKRGKGAGEERGGRG